MPRRVLVPVVAALAGVGGVLVGLPRLMRPGVRRDDRIAEGCARRGWRYTRFTYGLTLEGWSVSRRWELLTETGSASGSTTFALGAPEADRALVMVCGATALRAARVEGARFLASASEQAVGSDALRAAWRVYAHDAQDAQRVVTGLERLLVDWPARTGMRLDPSMRLWVCPHGVHVTVSRGLTDWARLQHLVRVGLAAGRRVGIA